jgi:acyl-CoA thioesterase FadM
MDVERLGRATLHSRVERWECDFNDHWNVRYYVRTFQLAAEAIATPPGGVSLGAGLVRARHLRFHRELFVNAPVEVRTALVADGPFQGAAVHLLCSEGHLAATALEHLRAGGAALPKVRARDLVLALPRAVAVTGAVFVDGGATTEIALGPIRPGEIDHTGALLWEELMRRLSLVSHQHVANLGFTRDFVRQSGVNRMSAEIRVERLAEAVLGTCLRAKARLVEVGRKSFTTESRIETESGTLLASIRQTLLVVDLTTRRAVEAPDFLRAASKLVDH